MTNKIEELSNKYIVSTKLAIYSEEIPGASNKSNKYRVQKGDTHLREKNKTKTKEKTKIL